MFSSRKSTDPSVDSTQASVGALTELQSALESVAPRLIYAVRKTEPTVGEELRSKVDKVFW